MFEDDMFPRLPTREEDVLDRLFWGPASLPREIAPSSGTRGDHVLDVVACPAIDVGVGALDRLDLAV